MDLGKISLCLCKDAHEAAKKGEKGYAVKVGVGKYLEELDWSDIDLDDDQYTLQVFPINFCPTIRSRGSSRSNRS